MDAAGKDRMEAEEGKDGKKGGGKPKGGAALVPPPPAPSKGVPQTGTWPPAPGRKVDSDVLGGDANNREKGRDKKDGWKDRGADRKQDNWKQDRRRKVDEVKKEFGGENSAGPQVLNGGALLSLLKANTPSHTRYTREELFAIGQLPASKVKPPTLNVMIDKDNVASTLLFRRDKARRRGDGDEDDDEEGRRERRPRGERGRRGDSDDDDEEAEWPDRRPKDTRWSGGWKQDEWSKPNETVAEPSQESWHQKGADESSPQWDMPDAGGPEGSLLEFTLGDIRKAEKSIASGMTMKDYKASLRTGPGAAEPAPERKGSDPFQDSGNDFFFEEEEEDVSRASRGFGKWFASGRAAEAIEEPADPAVSSSAPAPTKAVAPAAAAPAHAAASAPTPAPPGATSAGTATFAKPAAPVAPGIVSGSASTATAPLALRQPVPPGKATSSAASVSNPRVPAPAGPLGKREEPQTREPGRVMNEDASSNGRASNSSYLWGGQDSSASTTTAGGSNGGEAQAQNLATNAAGKSILSMLAGGGSRPADTSGTAPAAGAAVAAGTDSASNQGKLSVADLFQIAKGQQLPPIPPMTSAPPRNTGGAASARIPGAGASEAEMNNDHALKMATQLMWAAAAKAGAGPPGSRHPGLQQPGMSAYGSQNSWEAYAQAQQAAMGYSGRGGPAAGYQGYPGAMAYGGYGMAGEELTAAQAQRLSELGFDGNPEVAKTVAALAAARAKAASLGAQGFAGQMQGTGVDSSRSFQAASGPSGAGRGAGVAGSTSNTVGSTTGVEGQAGNIGEDDAGGCSQS